MKSVVVKHYYTADLKPRPNPVNDVFCGLVDVNINMTETDLIALDDPSSLVWKYTLKYPNFIKT